MMTATVILAVAATCSSSGNAWKESCEEDHALLQEHAREGLTAAAFLDHARLVSPIQERLLANRSVPGRQCACNGDGDDCTGSLNRP